MKFEVKGGVIHIDGQPKESEMEIGIAIKKQMHQAAAQIQTILDDQRKLIEMIELTSESHLAMAWFREKANKRPWLECFNSNGVDVMFQPKNRITQIMMAMTLMVIENKELPSEQWVTITNVNDLPNPKDHAAVFVQWNNQVLLIEIKNSTPKVMLDEFATKGFRKWHPLIYPKK